MPSRMGSRRSRRSPAMMARAFGIPLAVLVLEPGLGLEQRGAHRPGDAAAPPPRELDRDLAHGLVADVRRHGRAPHIPARGVVYLKGGCCKWRGRWLAPS